MNQDDQNTSPLNPINKSEILKKLTPEQYQVTQEKATERPFTGQYVDNHEKGIYKCIVCSTQLFASDAKFDSGTGWPSFDQAANQEQVKLVEDNSLGMSRTEVICKNCGAHLGHLFSDGPTKTGQRFCINSCSLNFEKKADA